jgi:uncharacterized protein YjiS (DUF1127 family)
MANSGTAAKPSGTRPIAVGPIGRRIRRAAIDIDRRVGRPLLRFAVSVVKWLERDAERRCLQSLSYHMLRDVGLIEREARARWHDK